MATMEECYALYRKSPLTSDEVLGGRAYMRAISGFVKKTITATSQTRFAFSLPLQPELVPPSPVLDQPADHGNAIASLPRLIAAREEAER